MRRLIGFGAVTAALMLPAGLAASPALAANPNGTGPPSQTCLSSTAPNEPGNASTSPGSPFNETLPGTGGVHYTEKSQYDVACYQVSQH